LVPIKVESEINNDYKENMISLDPGLKTFMTGITKKGMIKIGENVNKIMCEKLKRLNKIKSNKNISSKIKKKNKILINRKINQKELNRRLENEFNILSEKKNLKI